MLFRSGKIADRLYQHETETRNHREKERKMFRARKQDNDTENLISSSFIGNRKAQLRNFVGKPMDEMDMQNSNEPLADIYPNASVIFAGKHSSRTFLYLGKCYDS